MRLELLRDGGLRQIPPMAQKSAGAVALIEISTDELLLMARRAEKNASGKSRFGPVTLYLNLMPVTWKAEYRPGEMLSAQGRQSWYITVEAENLETARRKAKYHFERHYAELDRYGVFNDEVFVRRADASEAALNPEISEEESLRVDEMQHLIEGQLKEEAPNDQRPEADNA